MIERIRTIDRRARKEHVCDGFRDVLRYMSTKDLLEIASLPHEQSFILEMKERGYKIQKGDIYEEQTYAGDGECYTLKVSKPMEEIMNKYNLYGSD